MERRSKYLLLSAGVVAASAVGLALTRRSVAHIPRGPPEACVTARLVDHAPPGAPIVDESNGALDDYPVFRTAVRTAIDADARGTSIDLTVDRDDAVEVLAAVRDRLPYHDGDGPAGLYVHSKGRIVVLNAVGVMPVEYEQ